MLRFVNVAVCRLRERTGIASGRTQRRRPDASRRQRQHGAPFYAAGVRCRPTRTDALLGAASFCLVAAAVVTDGGPPGRAALAYCFAIGFGALPLCGRQWPVPALLATAGGLVVGV